MKREKEVPADLLAYMEQQRQRVEKKLNTLDMFCTIPVRAVRMKMLTDLATEDNDFEGFRTAIVPPVDVYTRDKAEFKKGFLKRDHLSYFVANTTKAFPFGHVYDGSGNVCLGSIFVPSAVPERDATMPIETLFLHNDRNLNHGNSSLRIKHEQCRDIAEIIRMADVTLGELGTIVIEHPGTNIIMNDEIWSLSADVAEQKPLPEALRIMSGIYKIVFRPYLKPVKAESEENNNG